MSEYVNFADIEDICSKLEKVAYDLTTNLNTVQESFENTKNNWEGFASESFQTDIKKLINNFEPATMELVYSILFLASVGDGFEKLTNDQAHKLISIVADAGLMEEPLIKRNNILARETLYKASKEELGGDSNASDEVTEEISNDNDVIESDNTNVVIESDDTVVVPPPVVESTPEKPALEQPAAEQSAIEQPSPEQPAPVVNDEVENENWNIDWEKVNTNADVAYEIVTNGYEMTDGLKEKLTNEGYNIDIVTELIINMKEKVNG